ncbi:flavonol glycosyltransferase UGT72AF1 [Sesbania bispinosa]|nr:flavonol glycosyltransferase UGT72AF1 [Sesbania bispinosa]
MVDGVFLNTYDDVDPISIRAIRENPFYKETLTPSIFPIGLLVNERKLVIEKGEECLAWLDKQASEFILFVMLDVEGICVRSNSTELGREGECDDADGGHECVNQLAGGGDEKEDDV